MDKHICFKRSAAKARERDLYDTDARESENTVCERLAKADDER